MSSALIQRTESFVRDALSDVDGSHDWWHIHRVRLTAVALAKEEGADAELVELAALLHDVKDWKYSGDADAGANAAREFLKSQDYDDERIERICGIIRNMGFKESLATDAAAVARRNAASSVEMFCVADADKLDAIGAIGIGRTFCYGGAKRNPMHVPGVEPLVNMTMEKYVASHDDKARPNTTINHFAEKLFLLKDMMKTESGKARAEKRHETMVAFVDTFMREWNGEE